MGYETATVDPAAPGVELVCWKIWGGNRRTMTPVAIPGLKGVLCAQPKDSDQGGDLYFLSACGSGAVARLCVADVTGHGAKVAAFSASLEKTFGSQIHREDPSAVLRQVNQRTVTDNLTLVSTGVCLSYNSLNGVLSLSNAGHPNVLHRPQNAARWKPIALDAPRDGKLWNIPLGIDATAHYQMGTTKLKPGARILIVTDGLLDATNSDGIAFGTIFRDALAQIPVEADADTIATEILAALDAHMGDATDPHDDVTFVVLEVLPYQRSNRYTLLVRNNWHRLMGRLRSSL